jgi:hypothetical protein
MSFMKRLLSDYKDVNSSELFIDCFICKKKYFLTSINNSDFWKKNLKYNPPVLVDIKRIFNNESTLEDIIQYLTGVVRFKKKDTLHICFRYNGIFGYFDCIRSKDNMFHVLSVWCP